MNATLINAIIGLAIAGIVMLASWAIIYAISQSKHVGDDCKKHF